MGDDADPVEDEMDDAALDAFAVDAGIVDDWDEVEDASPTGVGDYDVDAEDGEEHEETFAEYQTLGKCLRHSAYYGPIDVERVREAARVLDAQLYKINAEVHENALARKPAFETIVSHLRDLVEAFGLEFTEPVLGESWAFDGRGALILGHFMSDVSAHDSKNLKKRQMINTAEHGMVSAVVARVWNEWSRALGDDAWKKVTVWNVVPYKAHACADSPKGHKGKPLVSNEMMAMWYEFQLIERGIRCAVSLLNSHTIVTFGVRAAEFIDRSLQIKAATVVTNTATAHICYLRAHGVRREKEHATRVNIRQEHYAAFGKAVDDILDAPAIAAARKTTKIGGAEIGGAETPGMTAAKAFMSRVMKRMNIKEIEGVFHAYTREEARELQRQRAREYGKQIYRHCFLGGANSKFTRQKFYDAQRQLKSRVPHTREAAKNFLAWHPKKFYSAQRKLKSREPHTREAAKNFLAWDPQKFYKAQYKLKSRVPQP